MSNVLLRIFQLRARPLASSARLLSLRLDGIVVPVGRHSGSSCLLARSVLRYRWFDLAAIARADRQGALRAELMAWQPFPDSRYFIDLNVDQAQVFAIDRVAMEAALAARRKQPARWWPEPLMHAAQADGMHLVRCVEGFDGQAWQGGVLRASRWWAQPPSDAEWQSFVRQSRLPGATGDAVPRLLDLAWQTPARALLLDGELGGMAMDQERLLVGAVALLLTAATGLVGREAWDAREAQGQAFVDRQAMQAQAAPVLAAREKALGAGG